VLGKQLLGGEVREKQRCLLRGGVSMSLRLAATLKAHIPTCYVNVGVDVICSLDLGGSIVGVDEAGHHY